MSLDQKRLSEFIVENSIEYAFLNSITNSFFPHISYEIISNYLGIIQQLLQEINLLNSQKDTSDNLLEAIFESIRDQALIVIDLNGKILNWNRGARFLYGYQSEEIINKVKLSDLHQFIGQEQTLEIALEETQKMQRATVHLNGKRKSGDLFPVSLSLNVCLNKKNQVIGYLAIAKDIEEEKKLELLLMNSHKAFEEFAYIASHDLKAPIRGIEKLVNWIKEELVSSTSDSVNNYLSMLENRTIYVSNLINGILDYARATQGGQVYSQVNLSELISETIQQIAIPKEFKVFYDHDLPEVYTAKIPLYQILKNLIENAIRHHDKEHGVIKIICQSKEDALAISVIDDGPGIDKKYHELVFKVFQTLKSKEQTHMSGMGLSIVKKLISLHGGNISIYSSGRGTEFKFIWPLATQKLLN